MNYAEIKTFDIANGAGVRTSLFVSGCTHHCKECFNQEAWDFNYGNKFDQSVQDALIEDSRPDYIRGITILGGEPMEVINQKTLRPFIERLRRELPDKDIWVYSGYTYEELTDPNNTKCHSSDTDPILSMIDVLVDGEFQIAKKDISLRFRGSSNQRVIDLKGTRKCGHIVLSGYGEREL